MRKFYTLPILLLGFMSASAQSENTFTGTNNTNWTVASNWSKNATPGSNEVIVIPMGKSVTYNTTATHSSVVFRVSGTLTIPANRVATLNQNSQIGVFGGGQITGGGRIVLNGVDAYTGQTIVGPQYANSTTGNLFVAGVLPVRIREFNVSSSANSVKINWLTDLELSVRSFSVERSADSRIWQTISTQDAKGVTFRYSFEDAAPMSGVNYYRLKITELDGSSRLSNIKAVHYGNSNVAFKVFPNPAVHTLRVYVKANDNEKVQVTLVNRMGQVIRQKDVTPSTAIVEFDVKTLAEGDYIVNLRGSNGLKQSRTIIVSHK